MASSGDCHCECEMVSERDFCDLEDVVSDLYAGQCRSIAVSCITAVGRKNWHYLHTIVGDAFTDFLTV